MTSHLLEITIGEKGFEIFIIIRILIRQDFLLKTVHLDIVIFTCLIQ
jgi:hypothetical protein